MTSLAPLATDMPELPAASAPPVEAGLTGPQKAAVIVRLLATAGTAISLQRLPESIQASLVRSVAALGQLSPQAINRVVEEFTGLVEAAALMGPGGVTNALDLLGESVSASVAQRLRQSSGYLEGQDPWERIADKETAALLPLVEAESDEVAAVLLSKLGVTKSAQLLGMLPGERARNIAYAISMTAAIPPQTVHRIGTALASILDIKAPRAFHDGPVDRVGAILNSARSATRNDVLAGLDQEDSEFAEDVRRAIFTFANIPERISERDIPKIVRGVDQDVLVRALASAQGELDAAVEFILSSLSQRMGDTLRDEIEEAGEIDETPGEEAMNAVVAVIRDLEASGEIHLVTDPG